MNRHSIIFCTLILNAVHAVGADTDSIAHNPGVLDRQLTAESAATAFVGAPYSSPALRQFRLPFTFGTVGAGWKGDYMSAPTDPQRGSGEQYGFFDAEAEVKSGTSTLWGNAGYTNGVIRSVLYNETSDIDHIYPYVTADEVGGDLRAERYSFGGGYADRRGRLAWGVSLSYSAGLYYRNVDPRPRNTTGLLDIDAGIALRCTGDYYIGIAGAYRKYRQTCDLMFMSEIGEAKVYHLTGLGNRYERFTGSGYSNYYNGHRYMARITLVPASRTGFSLDTEVSRFTFDHILKDLNRLPMASVWHNELRLHGAWRTVGPVHSFGVKAEGGAYRRHGSENIFGDAVTGTYPQIGSLEMYADNLKEVSAALFYEHTAQSLTWSVTPAWGYTHRSEMYASPYASRKLITHLGNVTAAISSAGKAWYWRLEARYGAAFGIEPGTLRDAGAAITASRKLRGDHAIGITAGYRHARYSHGPVVNGGNASIRFIF